MRVLYIVIFVALMLVGLQALRYDQDGTGTVLFLVCMALIAALAAFVWFTSPANKTRDIWAVRMVRLWMEGTERKLNERAGRTPTGTQTPPDRPGSQSRP